MTNPDVYTGRPIELPTEEHIIPSFLGGRVSSGALIDKSTNDLFGWGIDAALHKGLHPYLVIADARGNRHASAPPRPMHKVQGSDGQLYDLEAGGVVRARPAVSIEPEGERVRIKASGSNEEQLRRSITRWARRRGLDPERILDPEALRVTRTSESSLAIQLDVNVFNTDCYRAISKIACNLFASFFPTRFLDPAFDAIRRWILGDRVMQPPPLHLVEWAGTQHQLGPLDHLVRVTGSQDGEVLGLVVLFDSLAFIVRIGGDGQTETFTRTYRVDQLGRKDLRDADSDRTLTLPPYQEAYEWNHESFVKLAQVQLERLAAKVFEIQQRAFLTGAMRSSLDQLGLKEGDILDEEIARSLAAALSAEVVEGLRTRIEHAGWSRMNEHGVANEDE